MSPNAPTRPLILASTSRYRASLLQRFGLPATGRFPMPLDFVHGRIVGGVREAWGNAPWPGFPAV